MLITAYNENVRSWFKGALLFHSIPSYLWVILKLILSLVNLDIKYSKLPFYEQTGELRKENMFSA